MDELLVHGGADAAGTPRHDFSTNRNSCGPCPHVVAALESAHIGQYPDPAYIDLRAALASFHGVSAHRVVAAGSASEFIHRITMHAARSGATYVSFPKHHYGDYSHAARNWGLQVVERSVQGQGLHWACEPSSPLGLEEEVWTQWNKAASHKSWRVLDCAYAPLRLGSSKSESYFDEVWQMWTPNKALGMTGIRAAYVIAPNSASEYEIELIRDLAPSWVVGAHGVCMLHLWTTPIVQEWLARSLQQLQQWKTSQISMCNEFGWQVIAGHQANYFVAQWPTSLLKTSITKRLQALRDMDIKLRDCTSFGLSGHVRLGVLAPESQQALQQAWKILESKERA